MHDAQLVDVYLRTRQNILAGSFLPNQVVEPSAAIAFHATTIGPVLAAFALLRAEGYLTQSLRGDWTVAPVTGRDFREAASLRAELVVLAARKMGTRLPAPDSALLSWLGHFTLSRDDIGPEEAENFTVRTRLFVQQLARASIVAGLCDVIDAVFPPYYHRIWLRSLTSSHAKAVTAGLREVGGALCGQASSPHDPVLIAPFVIGLDDCVAEIEVRHCLPAPAHADFSAPPIASSALGRPDAPRPYFGRGGPEPTDPHQWSAAQGFLPGVQSTTISDFAKRELTSQPLPGQAILGSSACYTNLRCG